jgi:hypothetical protein
LIENDSDTLALLSIYNIKSLNQMRIDFMMCKEMNDSLVVNLDKSLQKEKLYFSLTDIKDSIIKNNETIIANYDNIITIKNTEIKQLKRTNKLYKIGGLFAIVLALLI